MSRYTETYKVDVPEGKSGVWSIEKFTVDAKEASLDRVLSTFSFGGCGRSVPAGTYTSLKRRGDLIMSDTPDEIRDHIHFIVNSHGHVLIAGLGIGMVLNAVAMREEVTKVTIIENSADVIKLAADHYRAKPYGKKLEIVQADIFDWKPAKGTVYDVAWFDVWDNLCLDNLKEMATLHRRFSRIAKNKGSWGHEYLKDIARRQRRSAW